MVTPLIVTGRNFASYFPAKPVEPESELGAYTRVRLAWRDLAKAFAADLTPATSFVADLATAVQCVHADALSIRRINATVTQSLARADALALETAALLDESRGRLAHCGVVAKLRPGTPMPCAFLACAPETWRDIAGRDAGRDRVADVESRILAGQTVTGATASYRLATGAEILKRDVELCDRLATAESDRDNLESTNSANARGRALAQSDADTVRSVALAERESHHAEMSRAGDLVELGDALALTVATVTFAHIRSEPDTFRPIYAAWDAYTVARRESGK